jgi:hypothetical protein
MQRMCWHTLQQATGSKSPWQVRWYATLLMRRSMPIFCVNSWRNVLAICLLPTASSWAQPIEALNPDVTADTINDTICVVGYTKTVRPSSSYTNGVKKLLLQRAGLNVEDKADYELDHIIPLALGGHPRNPKNLALQLWEGEDGARRKDKLEVKLQCMVCTGKVPLDEARAAIYNDWQAAAKKYHQRCSRKKYDGD